MRYPEFLKEGGVIGVVAPSFGCKTEPYCSGLAHARERFIGAGYRLKEGPNCEADDGVGISSTPQNCGTEFTTFYTSGENDVLMSCGGGELMCEILPYVDFDAIKKANPKWFMGYSDNTNLTFLLTTLCDVASIYGPCIPTFGREPWHKSVQDAMDVLTGKKLTLKNYGMWEKDSLRDADHPFVPYHLTEKSVLMQFDETGTKTKAVAMKGRLLGGCLDCLTNLVGTSYDRVKAFTEQYKEDGIIWFLESCELNVFGIRRAMWQLEQAGWFQYTKGFIIGRPMLFGQDIMGLNQYDAVLETAGKYHVPVIMDADIGHLPPQMPVICGSMAEIETKGNKLTLTMELR